MAGPATLAAPKVAERRRCALHQDALAWGRCRGCQHALCSTCFDEARTSHGRCLTCRIGGRPDVSFDELPPDFDELPHDVRGYVLFPPDDPCPLCARRGAVEPAEPLPLAHYRLRTAPRDAADRRLAALLGPPRRPSFGRALLTTVRAVRVGRLPLLALLFGAIPILQPKRAGEFAFLLAVSVVLHLLGSAILLYWQWPTLLRPTWESACYCHRHRAVFVPGRPEVVGVGGVAGLDRRPDAALDALQELWLEDGASDGDGDEGDDADDD
jgi:hypothetical protein